MGCRLATRGNRKLTLAARLKQSWSAWTTLFATLFGVNISWNARDTEWSPPSYQDNKSAILMETNGKSSSSKRTKHIRICYFFIQDKIEQQEIAVKHCPTDQMWIDINTKPKQGLQFRQFRSELMGVPVEHNDNNSKQAYDNTVIALSRASGSPQECVGGGQMSDRSGQVSETQDAQMCHVEGAKPLVQIVQGRRWSPGVYRALRVRGASLEVAWRRAFL
jgi:hypothetical protein